MIKRNAALAHHLLEITVADAIAAVPSHRPKDDFAFKMTPLEICHDQLRPRSAHFQAASKTPTRFEPDSLILGKPFELMLEAAQASYDWTIYDGPSVEASAQVTELARAIGFTLLVVRKRSSVKLLRHALRKLDGVINLAILNNR
jgi:hypothetical protein